MNILVVTLEALVASFLVSRLLLRLMKRWDGGYPRLIVVNAIALILTVIVVAASEGGGRDIPEYVCAQLFWLVFDLARPERLRTAAAIAAMPIRPQREADGP